ncbi:DUF1062 domain-containing protein [Reyranella sp.]|uniref:DUF1062 domain-containing protein n=1 Tax=Reyranella sp. TaxID=1929291 RepID=UPI003D0A26F6
MPLLRRASQREEQAGVFNTLRVQWSIAPQTAPRPWLNCSRCRGPRGFRSSGKIRVNANGRRIDAWLIYRCTACDGTWNRPVVERLEVAALDRQFLLSLQANEPDLVRSLAFDVAALKRWTGHVQEFDDVSVARRALSESSGPVQVLEIECRVPRPIGLRADRLLASELQVSRSCIRSLEKAARLRTVSPGSGLRRSLRDGMRLIIDASFLPEGSVERAAGTGCAL